MAVYIVTYDLKKIGQNYECITGKLKALKAHHAQGSVWFVNYSGKAWELRNDLDPCMDTNDVLFVGIVIKDHWASYNHTALAKWLASNGVA